MTPKGSGANVICLLRIILVWILRLVGEEGGYDMAFDEKETHAQEFTDIENQTLDLWLTLENAGLDEQAAKLLNAGLQFEHYTSLLDDDVGKRTQQQIGKQRSLQLLFDNQISLSQQMLNKQQKRVINRKTSGKRARWVLGPDGFWHWQEEDEER